MHVTLRQLQVFEAVARLNSYTRAAEALHLSQPGVSMQIKQLEESIGLPLFEHVGKKIYLTTAGREMYTYSQTIGHLLDEADVVIEQLKGLQSGRLAISVATTASHFATRLLAAFSQRYEGVTISLDITNRESLRRQLEHNEPDLVIMGQPPEGVDTESEIFMENPLVMIAPPLLLIGDPMPIMLWGLPTGLRLEVGRWLRPDSGFRRVVQALTKPGLVWLYFVAVLVGWHDPRAYNLTLVSELAHDLEHLTFFGTAMLFWWHVIGAAPHIHRRLSRGVRIGYTLSVVPPNALTGISIAFASEPIYAYYTTVPRLGEMTALEDQMLGGVIMWIPGSMMYIIAALILLAQIVRAEEQKEPLSEPKWTTEEAMLAPGFEEQDSTKLKA